MPPGDPTSSVAPTVDANVDNTDDLLKRPTLRASRVNNVNAGRTNIKLDWEVEKLIDLDTDADVAGVQNTTKEYRIRAVRKTALTGQMKPQVPLLR